MAIIKQAENIRLNIKSNYTSVSEKFTEQAENLIVDATAKDLTLNCTKKIVSNGNKK
ncbi:hypothetical protein AGMMS50239_32960 [Bacteroidia bacterium]|nr:hypothetical protein AGMMS50239_32960 [Bacteroidia bacterium]